MPRSLFLTGLTIPSDRDRIGGGEFGLVFKGEREGKAVALKVLYKTHNNIVCHPPADPLEISQSRFKHSISTEKR